MGSGTGLFTRGGPCPLLRWPLEAHIRVRGGGGPKACWPQGGGPKAWWLCTGGPVPVVVTRPCSLSAAWWCGGKAREALGHYWGAMSPSLVLKWGAMAPSVSHNWGALSPSLGLTWGALALAPSLGGTTRPHLGGPGTSSVVRTGHTGSPLVSQKPLFFRTDLRCLTIIFYISESGYSKPTMSEAKVYLGNLSYDTRER